MTTPSNVVPFDKKKATRTIRVLGRLILDIQREKAGATFSTPVYPDNETLKKLGLSAIGEIHKPDMILILQEASRRDTGVRHLVNAIMSRMVAKLQSQDTSPTLSPELQEAFDHTVEKFGPALERLSDA